MSSAALTPQDIQLKVHATDWRDALRKAARPLLASGSIDQQYVDNMIEAVETHGAYIVIAPGLALGHARPDASVHRTGITVTTLAEPVDFGSKVNDPVDLVVVLASVNDSDHIDRLRDLSSFLAHADNLALLRSATSDADKATILSTMSQG